MKYILITVLICILLLYMYEHVCKNKVIIVIAKIKIIFQELDVRKLPAIIFRVITIALLITIPLVCSLSLYDRHTCRTTSYPIVIREEECLKIQVEEKIRIKLRKDTIARYKRILNNN